MKKAFDFSEFVNGQKWTFSKTYAKTSPHEYIVRKDVTDEYGTFDEAVMFIRENGFPMHFFRKAFIYYHLNGKLYWTMGEPLENTIIINRCSTDDCIISIRNIGGER